MKTSEIRNLSVDEIEQKVNALKKDLLNLRIEAKNQKLEQFSRLKNTKKDIARLLTVKNEIEKREKK